MCPAIYLKIDLNVWKIMNYLMMKNQDNTHVTEIPTHCGNSDNSELTVRGSVLSVVAREQICSEGDREALDLGNESPSEQPPLKSDGWTEEQENRLFQLHNIHGNRWAKISHYLPGKTDNCIKNHFYCTLRKAFRRVNRYISENKAKVRLKEIKNIVLSKIISVAQQRFQTKLDVNEAMIQSCCNIKNNLIKFAKDGSISEAVQADLIGLIFQINEFSRSFKKRKAKKPKKSFSSVFENQNGLSRPDREGIQYRPIPSQNGRDAPLLKKLDNGRSPQINIQEFAADFNQQSNSPFFNFNQGSPPHLINFELNSPVEEIGQVDNPFSIIANYSLNQMQYPPNQAADLSDYSLQDPQ